MLTCKPLMFQRQFQINNVIFLSVGRGIFDDVVSACGGNTVDEANIVVCFDSAVCMYFVPAIHVLAHPS